MSMPKPVCLNWRPPLISLGRPGSDAAEAARRVARAGHAATLRQHPSSLRVRRGGSLRWCGELTSGDTYAASDPGSGGWEDPDPQRRSSRGSGAQDGPACPAMVTRRLRPSRLSDVLALCSQTHVPSSNQQVTSTSIQMPGQARLAFLAVTHRYKRTHCLWLEQFQIADSARVVMRG
jgi:hypothetical protein